MTDSDRPKVLIAGAGVAALEAILALRARVGHDVDIEVLAPGQSFLYLPVTVAEAFDAAEARAFDLGEIFDDQRVRRHVDTLTGVDTGAQVVYTSTAGELRYDHLIIALGGRPVPVVPGALAFRGRPDVPALRAILRTLANGEISRLAFAVPHGSTWALPLYELALLATSRVGGHRSEQQIVLVTPEHEPLELFGPRAGAAVEQLLRARGVELHTRSLPSTFADGVLQLVGGATIAADRVVALPGLRGPNVPGLECDADGFVSIDGYGRVPGAPGVYAAGDAAAFPLKQGGLATQMADTIADVIAADVGAAVEPRPFRPVIRGLLLTGGEPIYLRAGASAGRDEPTIAADRAFVPTPTVPALGLGTTESSSSTRALWWPPAKIAGRYLAPYLATARPQPLAPMNDLAAPDRADAQPDDAIALALLLAEYDARWGDFEMALASLASAQGLGGELPPEYDAKRVEWEHALHARHAAPGLYHADLTVR
jgi:sulfide:quinone oxidoreductase